MAWIQKSKFKGIYSFKNEKYILEDIKSIIDYLNGQGANIASATNVTSINSVIEGNLTLATGTIDYNGPLLVQGTITVPTGTTLNIN